MGKADWRGRSGFPKPTSPALSRIRSRPRCGPICACVKRCRPGAVCGSLRGDDDFGAERISVSAGSLRLFVATFWRCGGRHHCFEPYPCARQAQARVGDRESQPVAARAYEDRSDVWLGRDVAARSRLRFKLSSDDWVAMARELSHRAFVVAQSWLPMAFLRRPVAAISRRPSWLRLAPRAWSEIRSGLRVVSSARQPINEAQIHVR